MSARANWFVDALDVEDEPLHPSVDVEQVGAVIDLHGSEPRLRQELHHLVTREGRLYDAGVTCVIRDTNDTCCSACPVFTAEETDPLSALCKVGRAQERVLTAMAVARHGNPRAST